MRSPTIITALLLAATAAHSADITYDLNQPPYDINNDPMGAFDAAIGAAKIHLNSNQNSTATLEVPSGTWLLDQMNDATGNPRPGIKIVNFEYGTLVITGDPQSPTKPTLVFDQLDQYGIYINNSPANVVIKNLHLTRPSISASQGDVVSVNDLGSGKRSVTMKLHSGFKDPIDFISTPSAIGGERVIVPFDGSSTNEMKLAPRFSGLTRKIRFDAIIKPQGGPSDHFDIEIDDNALMNQLADSLQVGQQIAIKSKVGTSTIWGVHSDNTTFEDLRLTNSSRDGIWMKWSNNLTARRILIDRGDPINGKLSFFSQPSDGIHFWARTQARLDVLISGATTQQPVSQVNLKAPGGYIVEDCHIIGTADDAIACIDTDDNFTEYATVMEIKNNTINIGLARSIIVNNVDGAIIDNNTIISPVGESIDLISSKNSVISNNTIVDNRIGQGIWIQQENLVKTSNSPRPDNNKILDNTFVKANTELHSISILKADNTEVSGNSIVSYSTAQAYNDYDNNGNGTPDLESVAPSLLFANNVTSLTGNNRRPPTTEAITDVAYANSTGEVSVTWDENDMFIQYAEADSKVRSAQPGINFGSALGQTVSNTSSNVSTEQVFIRLPITTDYTKIGKAMLFLPVISQWGAAHDGLPYEAIPVDNNWQETSITWNNKPADKPNGSVSIGSVALNHGVSAIDLTDHIQQALDSGEDSISFRIDKSVVLGQNEWAVINFGTKNISDHALRPTLMLTPLRKIPSSADGFVKGGIHSGVNYSGLGKLEVKTDGNPDRIRESYLWFDLTGHTSVSKAVLKVYCTQGSNGDLHKLLKTKAGWVEIDLTYANRPVVISGDALVDWFPETDDILELDVTEHVKQRINNNKGNVGFSIQSEGSNLARYGSKENGIIIKQPVLTITP